jgi:hypothetical protein
MVAILPRLSRSAGAGGGQQQAAWDAVAIDNFVRRLRQQQGASLGVQTVSIAISEPNIMGNGDQYANTAGGYNQ